MNWLQKIAGYYESMGYSAWWIGPAGEIFEIQDTHHGWVYQNVDLLLDEYDIDVQEWSMNRWEESRQENYDSLREEAIKEQVWQLESQDHPRTQTIDPATIVLSEEQEEELYTWASESAKEGSDVEKVDLLIQNGWIRVLNKGPRIHIEGNAEMPKFWDKAEMMMIKLFPKVWTNTNYLIIVNDQEIYSADLQSAGNLRSAIDQSTQRSIYHMYNR